MVVGVAAIAVFGATRLRPNPVTARADPAMMIANAIGILMRSEAHALTDDQVTRVLPLLRVLRDIDPNDADVSRALAREIQSQLTAEQRAEVERVREEARQRREAQGDGQGERRGSGFGPPGEGGRIAAPGAGQPRAGAAAGRVQLRQRLLSRLIERLENRQ